MRKIKLIILIIIFISVGTYCFYYYYPRKVSFELAKEIDKPYSEFSRIDYVGFDYIENAERFGLAQLHQLRGRVGRGSEKSYCTLIYGSKTEICRHRMAIMEETNDGFKISEKDLELRGPGDFFGTRQHGLPELRVANLFKHMKILRLVQKEAREIYAEDPSLRLKENEGLRLKIEEMFKSIGGNISI